MKAKYNRGGKRKGAGRKPKYSEPTTTIAFRVPKSKVKDVNDAVKGVVNNRLILSHANTGKNS